MKKHLLPLLLLAGTSALAQVQNGDFEDWHKLVLFEHPMVNYETSSSNYETFFENGSLNVTEVAHEDGSALRVQNLAVGNQIMPGFFLTGFPPQQEGENLIFEGGLPASDPNVDGISMDIRYDIFMESPGFLIVQFKNNGVPVGNGNMGEGTFHFPLSGTQTEWTNMSFDFGGAVAVEFNEIVIGIASANLLSDDLTYPENSWIEIDNLALNNSTDVIPGGDFEAWAFVDPIFVPVNCDVDIHPFESNYVRSEDSNNGFYALGLISTGEGFVEVGDAVMGGLNTDEGILPQIQIDENSTSLEFYYKYAGANDLGLARVLFYNTEEENNVPVHEHFIELVPADEYTMVTYEFADDLVENSISADRMAIVFNSSDTREGAIPQSGSTLLIDDVQVNGTLFDGLTTLFNPNRPVITGYPNPTRARVVFDLKAPRSGFYRVYNSSGLQIDIVQFQNTDEVIHNLWGMPNGTYTFRFYYNNKIETIRVVKI
jgi:hypothetical protein